MRELQESYPEHDANPHQYHRWKFRCSRPHRECPHSHHPPIPVPALHAILERPNRRQQETACLELPGRCCPTPGQMTRFHRGKEARGQPALHERALAKLLVTLGSLAAALAVRESSCVLPALRAMCWVVEW